MRPCMTPPFRLRCKNESSSNNYIIQKINSYKKDNFSLLLNFSHVVRKVLNLKVKANCYVNYKYPKHVKIRTFSNWIIVKGNKKLPDAAVQRLRQQCRIDLGFAAVFLESRPHQFFDITVD